MKKKMLVLAFLAALSANAATIDRLIVRQQWPWSGKVKIEYILSGADSPQDVTVSLLDGSTPVDLSGKGWNFLTGDVCGVSNGAHEIILDADQLGLSSARPFNVRLSLANSPANMVDAVYMIVDLVNASNVTYVTRADLKNGKYGSYETSYGAIGTGFYSPLADQLIWTGITNDVKYMTTHMVFRKIPAANKVYTLGADPSFPLRHGTRDKQHQVKLTSDYWIGVFEVTQAQFDHIGPGSYKFNNALCAATRPADYVNYRYLRGSSLGLGWKEGNSIATARQVDAGSWMDTIRKRTGLATMDLPSDAQWEIAAVAESTTPLYSGKAYTYVSPSSTDCDANVNELARYKWNGGWSQGYDAGAAAPAFDCDTSLGTAKVGSYAPNAYGLYDTVGNVDELVLDYLREDLTLDKDGNAASQPLVNPKGATGANSTNENPRRVVRSGRWDFAMNGGLTMFWRAVLYDSAANSGTGFRLCVTEHDED